MACEDSCDEEERVELRWLRPDGTEAMTVTMRYPTADEAMTATEAALTALEDLRRLKAIQARWAVKQTMRGMEDQG